MNVIYAELSLDFKENRTLKTVKVKQNDKSGRKLKITLLDNGNEVSLAGLNIVTINANVGGTVTAYGIECEIKNNKVIVDICPPLTTLSGREHCEIRIVSVNGTVHTATFDMLVEAATASTDSPRVLKTTELAEKLKEIDARLDALEMGNISAVGTAYQHGGSTLITDTIAGTARYYNYGEDD